MKLTVQLIAQFDADAMGVADYVAATTGTEPPSPVSPEAITAGHAAERIRELARALMATEVKVS